MQVRRHEDQAGSLGALENGEENSKQMKLREMVDLEVGVCVTGKRNKLIPCQHGEKAYYLPIPSTVSL